MIFRRKTGNVSGCDSAPLKHAEPCSPQPAQPWRVPGPACCRTLGFTLIELMIVVSIMVILMGIAVPLYQQSLIRARESVLREDLYTLRNAIDQYTLDKQKAPQTLVDLTQAGYIKSLPRDPFTNSRDTWTTEMEDSLRSLDQTQPGIADVHSGSDRSSGDGTAYNTW
jgi:general secretion pathway protein G